MNIVAPYVGAWIETLNVENARGVALVAPYVGAWIETYDTIDEDVDNKSHPTWVRGLKHVALMYPAVTVKSHPTWVRGLKLCLLFCFILPILVAPYVGAWIETSKPVQSAVRKLVAPYVGAWIETSVLSPATTP